MNKRITTSIMMPLGGSAFFLVLLFLFVQLMPGAFGQRETGDMSKRTSGVEVPLLKQQESPLTPAAPAVACTLSGTLGQAPLGGATGILSDKVLPAGVPTSTCAGVTYPGTSGQAQFIYNVHYVTNGTGLPLCTTVTFTMLAGGTPTSNMQLSAFRAPFVPSDTTNAVRYLGDAGVSTGSPPNQHPTTFQLTVPANTTIALVVFNLSPNGGGQGATYRIDLSQNLCGPPCSGNYVVSPTGGSIVPGVTNTGNHCDDCDTLISLPFAYTLYDHTFTSVYVSSNGRLDFVTNNEPGGFDNFCLPSPPNQGLFDFTIFAWRDNLRTDVGAGSGIFTSISGTAPNRIFNIEFRTVYFVNTSQHANFEVRLYEGQARFDVIYGTVPPGNMAATAGVQKNAINSTQYFCNGSGGAPTGAHRYFLTTTDDFNHDGKPDYVLSNGSTRGTAAWYMHNNIFAGGAYGPTLPAGWNVIDVADFNGNINPDYALFNPSTHQTAIWYLSGVTFVGGAFGPTLPSGWTFVAVGDFNGDCRPDYVLYKSSTRQTAVWYMNNNVFAGGVYGPTLPGGWSLEGVADFNRDGKTDYLLFNASTRQSAIWYLSGATFVGSAFGPTLPSGWALTGTADFNGDGKPDYLLYNASTRQTAVWYMNNNVFAGGVFGPTLTAGWNLVAP
jgi:hypothetical protein